MHFVNHNLWKKKKAGKWRKEEFVFSERVGDRRPEADLSVASFAHHAQNRLQRRGQDHPHVDDRDRNPADWRAHRFSRHRQAIAIAMTTGKQVRAFPGANEVGGGWLLRFPPATCAK
jgi:hypothetical protein